jgi:hypothetical protein
LPPAAYHGLIGDYLKAVSPLTEATDAGILAHLIPAIGTILGPWLHSFGGDKEPTRFNTVVVGPTSTGRKGTAAAVANLLMKKVDPVFWKNLPRQGLSSGEGLIEALTDKEVEDKNGNTRVVPVEKRMYVVESELSKVLVQVEKPTNTLSQVMRQAYDSDTLSTMTVNQRVANGAHVSIAGHITPEELVKRLSTTEMANGFANRFLWFYSKSEKILPNAKPVPDKVLEKFAVRLRSVLAFRDSLCRSQSSGRGTDKGGACKARREVLVSRDAGAEEMWNTVYAEHRRDRPGFVGKLIARGSSLITRLSLLYAILEESESVRVPHLRAALAVWDHNVATVEHLFGEKCGDTLEDRLYELLKSGPMLTRDFYTHLKTKSADLQAALEKMLRNGLVEEEKVLTGKKGRPASKWSLVG